VAPVKSVKMGANIVITGSEKTEVEAAARALVAKGGKLLSRVEPMGSKWVVTCEDPDDRSKRVHSGQARPAAHDQGPDPASG
jgi:hypothetical protein